jgi:hypothetical protein
LPMPHEMMIMPITTITPMTISRVLIPLLIYAPPRINFFFRVLVDSKR